MNVLKAARSIIASDSNVTDITDVRIYAAEAPQRASSPYVVLRVVSSIPSDTKTSSSAVDFIRVQVDCYGSSFTNCIDLDDKIRTAIDRAPHGDWEGIGLAGIRYENSIGPTTMHERESRFYLMSSDYTFRTLRSATTGQAGVGNTLGTYASDTAANADGVASGSIYYLSAANIYGMPEGTLKRLTEY